MDALPSSTEHDVQFRVPPDPRLPFERHLEMATLWRDDLRQQREKRLARKRKLDEHLHASNEVLQKLMSPEDRHAIALLRREIQERHGTVGHSVMGGGQIPQSEIDKIKEALAKRGVPTESIRTAIKDLYGGWRQTHDDRYPLVKIFEWDKWRDYYHRPDPPPPPPRNPWVTFRPPYWGWQAGHDTGAVVDFNVGHQHLLDANTGHVGSIVTLDCPDASDISVGSRETHTQVAFWYQAPVTGLVEINVTAICGEARHWLRVVDEWGVSDASVSQNCHIMAHVLHPAVRAPSFQQASAFKFAGDNSTYRDEQHVLPGQTVFAPLVSDAPVAASEWMIIRAGVRCISGAITNDMEIYSRCTMSWFLSRIDVHIRE